MQTNGTHTSLSGGTLRGIACGAGAGALWGLVFLAPELVRTFPPITLTAGRYLAYGLIAACLIGPRLSTLLPKLRRREWFGLAWLSLAGNTLYYILLSNAVQTGGIAMTSLVIGFLPVAVTIIGSRDHGAVPMRRLAASLLFCIAGAVCIGWQAIAQPNAGAAQNQIVGLACAVGALASWTAYAVENSRWLGRLSDVSAHDWSLLTGLATGAQAILLVPVAVALDRSHHSALEWAQLSGVSIAVAVLASIAGNALWNQMSRLLPLTLVGQMILFETLFALIYGFMWEQRLPTLLELLAFILVVLSVLTCIAAHAKTPERDARCRPEAGCIASGPPRHSKISKSPGKTTASRASLLADKSFHVFPEGGPPRTSQSCALALWLSRHGRCSSRRKRDGRRRSSE